MHMIYGRNRDKFNLNHYEENCLANKYLGVEQRREWGSISRFLTMCWLSKFVIENNLDATKQT